MYAEKFCYLCSMEKLIKNFWIAVLSMAWAQNVGIGTAAPSERLHVNGNLRVDGALMPNGDAGTTGQVLTSQGPGMPPIWTTLATGGAIQVYQASTSATVNLPQNGTVTPIIGPLSLSLNAGQKVLLLASGHARNWPSDGYAFAHLRIRVNGNDLPGGVGGTNLTTDYRYTGGEDHRTWVHAWAISAVYAAPSAGTYDFTLVGWVNTGMSSAGMYVGGPGGVQPAASLIALVLP